VAVIRGGQLSLSGAAVEICLRLVVLFYYHAEKGKGKLWGGPVCSWIVDVP